MQEKFITVYQAAVAAGATANIVLETQDEQVQRTVTGLYVTPVAVNVAVNLVLRQQPIMQLAGSLFNAQHGPVKMRVDFPQGQQIQVQIINSTAGNVGPFDVVVRYEVAS